MKLSCNVARDLLPLYHDGVCCEESGALVEEHIAECADCRALLNELRGEIEVPREEPDDMAPLEQIERNVKKGRKRAWLRGVAAMLAVVLTVFAGANVWWYVHEYSYYRQFAEGHEPITGTETDAQGNTLGVYKTDENGQILGTLETGSDTYHWSDGLYSFYVMVPLRPGELGMVSAAKNDEEQLPWNVTPGQTIDTWIASFGQGEYAYIVGIDILTRTQVPGQRRMETEHTTEYVKLDADGNQIYDDYMDEEAIAHQDAVYEEYRLEIERIVQAVEAQWPFLAE